MVCAKLCFEVVAVNRGFQILFSNREINSKFSFLNPLSAKPLSEHDFRRLALLTYKVLVSSFKNTEAIFNDFACTRALQLLQATSAS